MERRVLEFVTDNKVKIMSLYHLLGVLSAALFLMTWYGLYQQIMVIETRRNEGKTSTRSLSVNQFTSSYLAFYANFVFAIALTTFNHYLFWTRLGALILLLVILYRIWQDRPTKMNLSVVAIMAALLLMGLLSVLGRPYEALAQIGTTALMLLVTFLLIQGTLHQCLILLKTKQAGDLSGSLFKSIIIKDISTLLFALTIPFEESWPLLLLNTSSVMMRGWLLWLIRAYR